MADAFFNTTTADAFIPEIWSKEVQIARESQLIMAGLVRRFDMDVAQWGDTIHVPNVGNLAAGDISTTDGSLAAVSETPINTDILIDKWKGTVINILDIVKAQSRYDLMALYSEKIAYSLGLIVEQDLMALNSTFTQNVGVFNTAVTDPVIRSAVQTLDESRTPFTDRHLAVNPEVKNTLLGIDKFVRY